MAGAATPYQTQSRAGMFRHGTLNKTAAENTKASHGARPSVYVTREGEGSDDSATADDHPVDEQEQDRADNRSDPAGRLICPSEERRGQKTTYERACNTEQDRHDPATRVTARHKELGDRTDDQTKQQPSDDVHFSSSMSGSK